MTGILLMLSGWGLGSSRFSFCVAGPLRLVFSFPSLFSLLLLCISISRFAVLSVFFIHPLV